MWAGSTEEEGEEERGKEQSREEGRGEKGILTMREPEILKNGIETLHKLRCSVITHVKKLFGLTRLKQLWKVVKFITVLSL